MNLIREAYALTIDNPTPSLGEGQAGLSKLVEIAVNLIFAFAGIIFMIMLFIGGLNYLMAGGDVKNAQAARDRLKNAFIGLVIVVAAFAITTLILNVLGLSTFVVIN